MRKTLTPDTIAPPFANYAHGVRITGARGILVTSGQLAITPEGVIPDGAEAQAALIFANLDVILAEGGATRADVLRLNAYVTDRAHMQGYMRARDAWLSGIDQPPASTLMIVSGFTKPEFVVEIEALAALR